MTRRDSSVTPEAPAGGQVNIRGGVSDLEARIGRELDDWTLETRIGEGGLAEVWRARKDGEVAAFKILRERDRSPVHTARFLREGRLLERLEHPGLPRCMGVVDGDYPYLILELLQGETLSARVRRLGKLSPDQTGVVADALLQALAYLHAQGIVHRDVKASNVFLTDDHRVLLLDLGLSVDPQDPLTTTLGDVMGTYAYMAPEQIAGAEVDHRCDLYSLGITLYEALAGVRPFQGRGAAEFLQAHRRGNAPPLDTRTPGAPPRLLDTVTRLMARDPAARPASATIALAMLTGAGGIPRSLHATPLVGRAAAIGAIQAVIDHGGRTICLGETGSGAGRMARYALGQAQTRGFETIAVRCRPRVPPGDVLGQIARNLERICGTVGDSVQALAPALKAQMGEGPVLLVIEDLEHLDQESTQALAGLFSRLTELATIMTGIRSPPEIKGHIVRLRSLRQEEVAVLLRGMLGTQVLPPGLATNLHRMTGGMPAICVLAIKELVGNGALRCEGLSDEGEALWRLDRTVPLTPTVGLHRLFGELLDGLEPEARRLLTIMAVAGEPLPMEVLADVTDDLDGLLGPLSVAGLVDHEYHITGEWVGLRRAAVASLLLDGFEPTSLSGLHRVLASALSTLPADPWRDERLVWHTAHGAEQKEAPKALLALGQQLAHRGKSNKALEVLSRALLPGIGARTAALLAIVRGEVLENLGRRDEAAEALKAGHKLAEDLAEQGLVIRALTSLALVYQEGGDEARATVLADEGLALIGSDSMNPQLPKVLLVAASSHRIGGRSKDAADLYHRCIEAALAQNQREYAAMAHGELGWLLAGAGQLTEATAHLEQEAAFLRSRGLHTRLVRTLYRLSVCRRRSGDGSRALEALDEAEELARFGELPYEWARARIGRTAVHMWFGDIEGATTLLRSAGAALDSAASAEIRLGYRNLQTELRMLHGDQQAALAAYQQAEEEAARAGFATVGAYHLGMSGILTADPDALTEALDILRQSGDHRLLSRLLLYGYQLGGEAEALDSALEEARACGDQLLLLEALFALGGEAQQKEANSLLSNTQVPEHLTAAFNQIPAVKWGRGSL